jgi:hypothetical protein
MMTKLEQIWQELESDHSLASGLLYKRYSGKILPNIYVALKAPERNRCIAVHLSISYFFDTKVWDKFRDIKIQRLPDEKDKSKQFLIVLLLGNQHKDIFSTLCDDLIKEVSNITDERILIDVLISRLEKWHLLFEKLGRQGLSEEAQRGLYGELYFLRKFLNNSSNPQFCIQTWKGPEGSVQDFQYSNWAIELKTTSGKNQQKIYISSERQLDTSSVPYIYLVHLSLEVRQKHGESLITIIENLTELLNQNPSALSIFRLKLLEAGYFDHQTEMYQDTGYSIRQENIYTITDNFPRITESMLPSSVGDVRYSIVIPENQDGVISEDELFLQIIKTE